jgi:hypothetical protein
MHRIGNAHSHCPPTARPLRAPDSGTIGMLTSIPNDSSAMGQSRRYHDVRVESAHLPTAAHEQTSLHFAFVP